MHRSAATGYTIDQTAGTPAMVWIVLKNFAAFNRLDNFIEDYTFFDHSLLGMLCDSYQALSYLRTDAFQQFTTVPVAFLAA